MHLSTSVASAALHSKMVVLLLLIHCLLLLLLFCKGFVFWPCFVVQYLVLVLIFESSCGRRESRFALL